MIVSLNWIKEFVNLDGISVDELTKRFGLSTAEIEGVTFVGKDIENVVVAKILTVENHPNSNHLHILTVDDGSGSPVQVVCGAPNVRVGLKTFFARVGANIHGVKIKPARLAGVESFGMCCGGDELKIDSDTTGIVELDDSLPVGAEIKDVLPIEDVLIEIDNKSLTNRPDLWGHYGIAREFAAIFNRKLKPINELDLKKYSTLPKLDIKVESKNCFRYCGLTAENISEKKSSPIIKLRLMYCGMRDINLLTDLANYVMLELGQPMHTFDASLVHGIRVIDAKENLKMETLEHSTHTIEPGAVVIADEKLTPVAIAGIKGGLLSGITDNTTSLLLESACFDSGAIRKTSRKLGLITDASLRYEKSLDPELCPTAIKRFLKLLTEIDGKVKITSSLTDCYTYKYPTRVIDVDADFISRRGGVNLTSQKILDILTRLGFDATENNGKLHVVVPSFRATKDVSIKEDLVEEVFRMYGYDNIKSATMKMPISPVEQIPTHMVEYEIKHALASLFDLNEVHTYIWNYEDFNSDVNINQKSAVNLVDASLSGHSGVRSMLTPSLLKIVSENKNKFDEIQIFEIGRIVDKLNPDGLVNERKMLSVALASEKQTEKELYFKLKQICNYICNHIVKTSLNFVQPANKQILHPINSCTLENNGQEIGYMGIVHPNITFNIDKRKHFAVLELDVNLLLGLNKVKFSLTPVSKFQPVSIDFNFVADKNMEYQKIEDALNSFHASYILEHSLKDIYVNDEQLKDKISYTINFVVTPKDKTLQTSDIEKFSNRLIAHMQQYGLVLRS